VTAFASAKDYVTHWSADHFYADQALIVPFPTLATFDANKQVWSVHIKAWLYLPFEGKKIKNYLSSYLPHKTDETKSEVKVEESVDEDHKTVDREKKRTAAIAIEENKKTEESIDDEDTLEDALRELTFQ
jgi:hypothetical protein